MKRIFLTLLTVAAATGAELTSGDYFITQSWSQEQDFKRLYVVQVPAHTAGKKLPVMIYLHGNGGNARRAVGGFMRKHAKMASRYIMVFADGYQRSWNIVSERSKADDRGFIEAIVKKLAGHDNVQADGFSIVGSSNGAAIVNQLAVECQLPNIRNYVSFVSPLNVWQYDGKAFKAKGDDNNYEKAVTPMTGKRLMNVSGTEDRLVPYRGGHSRGIPAKGGKLAFVDAEESTFLWAKAMGYKGQQLATPTRSEGKLEFFSYLSGDIVHVKVVGGGHGAGGTISPAQLLEFLEAKAQ
jgi:polyhydroxybutyrate depolymerase